MPPRIFIDTENRKLTYQGFTAGQLANLKLELAEDCGFLEVNQQINTDLMRECGYSYSWANGGYRFLRHQQEGLPQIFYPEEDGEISDADKEKLFKIAKVQSTQVEQVEPIEDMASLNILRMAITSGYDFGEVFSDQIRNVRNILAQYEVNIRLIGG